MIIKKLAKDSTRSRQPPHNQNLSFDKYFSLFFYSFSISLIFLFILPPFLDMQETIVHTHSSQSIPVQGIQHMVLKTSFITLNTVQKNISDFLKMIIEIFTQDLIFFLH